jgi:1-acyl-sn-glycerol-3-phosphate acyltransferase
MLAALFAVALWPFVRIDTLRLGVALRHTTAVVIANHRSFFDVPMALVAFHRLRRYPRVLVASHWFDRFGTGQLLRLAGAIPLDRDDPSVHLDEARRVLDAGIPILILPEGGLHGEPGQPTSTGEFKTGAARLSLHCDAGVWPLAHVGTDEVWPKGARLPRLNPFRRHRVVLLGGEKLLELADDPRAASRDLRSSIVELLEEAVEIRVGGADAPSFS